MSITDIFKHEQILDQTVLSGAKSIANRVDVGAVMVDATEEDLEPIKELIPYYGTPNMKMSVYKNRRGEYNRVFLWMRADKSTCRYKTLFVTDYNYNIIDGILDKRKIEEKPQGEDGENVVF